MWTAPHPSSAASRAVTSWQPSQSEHRDANRSCLRGELLLVRQVAHEHASTRMLEANVVDVQHAHAEAHLGANGIEVGIERFFRDGKVGDAHGNHAALAPYEERERLLQRNDFE